MQLRHNVKIVRVIALNALLLLFVLPVLLSFIWVTTLALHVLPIATHAQQLNNVQRVQLIIIGMTLKKNVWHVHLANFTILKVHNVKIVRVIALNALLLLFVLPVLLSFIWVTTLALHVLPIATHAQQLNNVQRVQLIIIGMTLKKNVWHVHLANFTILKVHNVKIVRVIALNALLLLFVLPVLLSFIWVTTLALHVLPIATHAQQLNNVQRVQLIIIGMTLKKNVWHVHLANFTILKVHNVKIVRVIALNALLLLFVLPVLLSFIWVTTLALHVLPIATHAQQLNNVQRVHLIIIGMTLKKNVWHVHLANFTILKVHNVKIVRAIALNALLLLFVLPVLLSFIWVTTLALHVLPIATHAQQLNNVQRVQLIIIGMTLKKNVWHVHLANFTILKVHNVKIVRVIALNALLLLFVLPVFLSFIWVTTLALHVLPIATHAQQLNNVQRVQLIIIGMTLKKNVWHVHLANITILKVHNVKIVRVIALNALLLLFVLPVLLSFIWVTTLALHVLPIATHAQQLNNVQRVQLIIIGMTLKKNVWHVHLANFTILKVHNVKIVRVIALNALLLLFVLPVLLSFIWVTTLALHVLPIATHAQQLNNVQRVQLIIIGMTLKKNVWHVHLANFTILKVHNVKIVRVIALNALLLLFVLPVLLSFIWVTTLALHVLPIATHAQQLNNVQRVQLIIIGMTLKKNVWHVHLANFTILKVHNVKIVRVIALNALLLLFVLPVLLSFIWVTTLALHVLPIATHAQQLNNVQRVQLIIIGMMLKKNVWHVLQANILTVKLQNALTVVKIAILALLLQFVRFVMLNFIWVTTLALHVLPIATHAQQLNNVQRVQLIIIGMTLKKNVWHVHLANFTILKVYNVKIVRVIALNALLLLFVLPVLLSFIWVTTLALHVLPIATHAQQLNNVQRVQLIIIGMTLKKNVWHVHLANFTILKVHNVKIVRVIALNALLLLFVLPVLLSFIWVTTLALHVLPIATHAQQLNNVQRVQLIIIGMTLKKNVWHVHLANFTILKVHNVKIVRVIALNALLLLFVLPVLLSFIWVTTLALHVLPIATHAQQLNNVQRVQLIIIGMMLKKNVWHVLQANILTVKLQNALTVVKIAILALLLQFVKFVMLNIIWVTTLALPVLPIAKNALVLINAQLVVTAINGMKQLLHAKK